MLIYSFMLYPLDTVNWVFIRDFKEFFGTKDNYVKRILKIPRVEYYRLFAAKAFNLFYLIGLPLMVLSQPWYIVVIGWLCIPLFASLPGVIAFIYTHVDETAIFPQPPSDGKMTLTCEQHKMMLNNTCITDIHVYNFTFDAFTQ